MLPAFAIRSGTSGWPQRSLSGVRTGTPAGDTVRMGIPADDNRISRVLGAAVIASWSELPRDIQETLFEKAVRLGQAGERDESLRERLAQFLHMHHKRTAKQQA